MLKTLIKIRLQGILLRQTKSSKKNQGNSIGKIVLMGLLFAYVGVVFCGMFGMLFSSLIEPLHLMGIDWLYFALMSLMIIMLCFVGSVFLTQHEIYQAKDNDLLLSMPISNRDILLSRVFVILILNYIYEILVAGPALYVYLTSVGMDAVQILMFVIVFLTLPLFVLALSCVFGWLMANIMRHVRRKNIVTLVLSLGFFGIYLYAVSSIQEYIGLLITNGKSIAQAIEQGVFPIYHLAIALNEGNFISLLIYLLCVLIPFVLVIYLLSISFVKLATSQPKTKKIKYVEKPMKENSMFKALLIREVRHFTSNAMVMLNGAIGIIFTIIGGIALIMYKDTIDMLLRELPGIESMITPILCVMGIGIGSMNIISASSVSLEGDRLWIIKSLPIATQDILLVKLGMHLVLCIPAGIFFSIVEVILFQLSILDAIIVVFVPVLFTFFIAVLGLLLNLWKPKFDWVNETVCVKQSMPVMMTMFISMGLVFVIVGGYLGLFANIFDLNSYMYLMIAIFITLSIALYYVLMTWGLRRFDEL